MKSPSAFQPFYRHSQKKSVCPKCGKLLWPDEVDDHETTNKGIMECMERQRRERIKRGEKPAPVEPAPSKESVDAEEKEWIRSVVWGK